MEILKQGSVFAPADDEEQRQAEEAQARLQAQEAARAAQKEKLAQEAEERKKKQTQVKEQALADHTPQLGEDTAETDDHYAHFDPDMQSAQQLEYEKLTEQQAKEAEKRAKEKAKQAEKKAKEKEAKAKEHQAIRDKEKEAAKDYREQLKEGAKEKVTDFKDSLHSGGSKAGNFGANLGLGLRQVTTKLPENVGRVLDVATAPVFKPVQTARKVGSTINRLTGGQAGRLAKPVTDATSSVVDAGKTALEANRAKALGRQMSADRAIDQYDTGQFAGREVEFMGRTYNDDTGMWEKPDEDDVYELTEEDMEYNAKRRKLEEAIKNPKTTSDQREAYQIQLDELMDRSVVGSTGSASAERYRRNKPSRFMHQLIYGDRPLKLKPDAKQRRAEALGLPEEEWEDYKR